MEALVVYFDALKRFRCVSIPYHLIDDFVRYCLNRNTHICGGIMYEHYQYFYKCDAAIFLRG